jgi:solute carrier family 12 sodium/potassium/chloride transporter 2
MQAQLLFMGILIVALANFIVGSIMGPTTDDELSKGFIGYNRKASLENRHNILKHN